MFESCIDVFCHILPPAFCQAANRALKQPLLMFERAQAIPAMVDVAARLQVMDAFPGYRQILSLASPSVEMIAGPDRSPELARIGNDAQAELVAANPDRFAGFIASLPLNNPEASLVEAERAVRELGSVGVQLYTNVNGHPLDAPEFLDIFGLMSELNCAVWLHPLRPMTAADYPTENVSKYDLWWAFGWPHETSVAMGRLVFAGLFDRWPKLVVITHHVGGTVALMEGRLGAGLELLGTRHPPEYADAVRTDLKEQPLAAFRRFHADTASFGSRAAIECGLAFFGADRLLFGTDMPFDPERGPGFIRTTLEAIRRMELTDPQRDAILRGNAMRLFDLK